jgi:proline iminopeptidase
MKQFSCIVAITLLLLGGCRMQKSKHTEEGIINVNETQLYYKIIGEGQPVVILHGGPGFDHNHMLPLSELANGYKVIFYDQRATGNSTGDVDSNSITVDNFVEDLEGLRKELNLGKINVIGHSWGAALAMFYSIQYPDNLKTLTLLGCGGASTEYFGEHFENIQKNTSEEDRLAMKEIEQSEAFKNKELEAFTKYYQIAVKPLFYDQSLPEREGFTYSDNTAKHQQAVSELLMKDLAEFDIYDQLSSINCPTLIIQGDSDPSPCEGTYKVHKHIEGSKVIFLQDTGHFILHESPREFFTIMRKFLKDEKSVSTSIPEEIEKRLKSVSF